MRPAPPARQRAPRGRTFGLAHRADAGSLPALPEGDSSRSGGFLFLFVAIGSELLFEVPLPEVDDQPADDEQGGDAGGGEDAVALDRVGRRLAAVVGDEA